MKEIILTAWLATLTTVLLSQNNIQSTQPLAEEVLTGNYDPGSFHTVSVTNAPHEIVQAIMEGISTDSLKSYLLKLSEFGTRNTGSDTLSNQTGIGAARRWVYQRFQQISQETGGKLIPSYLQFDQNICGVGQHRNIFAVLPGLLGENSEVIILEAHVDSRNEDVCDGVGDAHGMEDNGSGTALVLELARVMSHLTFNHTLVFMATIGEEQGLYGAAAFAEYAVAKGIPIKAVLNNDIVGGIICGETSSSPSCPGLNHVDSTQVRLFSNGGFNSKHKQLARFVKLEYQEEVLPVSDIPMLITVMSAEDRVGRGGDHIPFRQNGFPAIRFTSANEHGNANVSDPDYHDRQHTMDDILGVDTDGDLILDSFFVDFNYLGRNAVINGVAAGMAAIGPETPDFMTSRWDDQFSVNIIDPLEYGAYRVFIRTQTNDFDTIYTLFETSATLPKPDGGFFVSIAAVDSNGIESLFSNEKLPLPANASEETPAFEKRPVELFQNRPNPFDEATLILFQVHELIPYKEAYMLISDFQGKEINRIPVKLQPGMNEILYTHGFNTTGIFAYSLVVDGKILDTRRMVFAN